MARFILASGSPRRKELLEQVGMTFSIEAAHGEEIITKTEPSEIVRELSLEKALEVAERVSDVNPVGKCNDRENLCVTNADAKNDSAGDGKDKNVVIGADTIVVCDGEIMGKPKDEADAKRMLTKLQNHTHQVFTGVAVIIMETGMENHIIQFFEKTDVTMYPMSEEQIDKYITSGESLDKAGAYAIQGKCAAYIKGICGEYVNVVGLPVARLLQELMKVGIEV